MAIAPISIEDFEVYRYVRGLLSWDDQMSVALRELPIERGECFVFLPVGETIRSAGELTLENHVVDRHHQECRSSAVRFVDQYLQGRENGVALFATAALEGDPTLPDFLTPFVFVPRPGPRSAVYLYIEHYERNIDAIMTAFNEARPFTSLVVLSSFPPGLSGVHRASLMRQEEVNGLAALTEHLILSAVDDSTYLVWVAPSVDHTI